MSEAAYCTSAGLQSLVCVCRCVSVCVCARWGYAVVADITGAAGLGGRIRVGEAGVWHLSNTQK